MKLTPALRTAINREVRALCGANPLAEVGCRDSLHGGHAVNALNWVPDADLFDLTRLADLREIDDHPAIPGAATLDLYVTSGIGARRELETNVYVTIKDGALADIHAHHHRADARTRAILGRAFDNDDNPPETT